MNWEALGAISEAVGSVAIIATLIYLAIQIRHLKRQNVPASFQHTYSAINDFDDAVSQSEALADIIVRGQRSLDALTQGERLRFEHTYGRLLNIVESWHFQVVETAGAGTYRDEQLRNIREFVRKRCDHPGVLAFWSHYKNLYNPAMHALMDANTRAGQRSTPAPAQN